jgi:hypothetical protein
MADISEVCNEGKAIPVTVNGGPESCEMSGLPHFLGNWLTMVVQPKSASHTGQPPVTPRKIPGTRSC